MTSAHALAGELRVASLSDTSCARAFSAARDALDLPDNSGPPPLLGKAAKIRRLAEFTDDRSNMLRFLNTRDQANLLNQVRASLKKVA